MGVMKTYKSTNKSVEIQENMSEARCQVYTKLYRKLDMKETKNDVCKMTKL
jgi:hypothetical protein